MGFHSSLLPEPGNFCAWHSVLTKNHTFVGTNMLCMTQVIKAKLLNALLIFTSLFGFLEWGKDNQTFLFQAEVEILTKLVSDPGSVIHPFTLLPLFGQLLLLITLFQKSPGRILTFLGLAGIGVLLALMFIIGLMSLNVKILLSTLPFLITAFITIRHHRKNTSH